MAIHRLNHAVLYIGDLARSTAFYRDQLGFEVVSEMRGGAFLRAPGSDNDHDLGLFALGDGAQASDAGTRTVGLYHLAWEVDTLGELADLAIALRESGALVGASDHGTTKSLYVRDPDGLELELVWLIPADLIDDRDLAAKTTIAALDLDAELARFGADARSGLGVSRPSGV
ncbi:VOC family protein [Ilumatobacter sp.]|uniref:VOC family protein n=1 Tax=Ilumatobacter sp. TaxID=1967498 RepID=UPI003C59A42B